jgi:hypothetical protein
MSARMRGMRHLWSIITLIAVLISGCGESTERPPAAAESPEPTADPAVNRWLLDAAKEHGIPATIAGNWVQFTGRPVRMNASVSGESSEHPGNSIIQVEFRLRWKDGPTISQPVVGWAEKRPDAIANAQGSFLLGSFHALLGAFVDPKESHVVAKELTIGGKKRIVTFGETLTKTMGQAKPPDNKWHDELMAEIQKTPLSGGLHWIDVYHGWITDHAQLEIQLDSQRWNDMESKLANAHWPRTGQFVSVRQFLIVQDPDDPTRPQRR